MSKKPTWRRLLPAWALTSAFIPFVIFLILEFFTEFELNLKILVALVGVIVWILVLLPFAIMDWDDMRRERIKEVCQGDAMLRLWDVTINIRDDGTSTITRKVEGTNIADSREYFELESWTDPDTDPQLEAAIKARRKIAATVSVVKSGNRQNICRSKEYPPKVAKRINRVVHLIPVSPDGSPLEPHDEFELELKEETELGTWKIEGDFYLRRVRHVTERMRVELRLPRNWRFPRRIPAEERIVVGEVKDPSCGEWARTKRQPSRKRVGKRDIVVWELNYPKLLSIYRLTYHSMERI